MRQQTDAPSFKKLYNQRAGIEGTISQGTRAFSLRRSRYIGLAKTHLQNIAIACAINLTLFYQFRQKRNKNQGKIYRSFVTLGKTRCPEISETIFCVAIASYISNRNFGSLISDRKRSLQVTV